MRFDLKKYYQNIHSLDLEEKHINYSSLSIDNFEIPVEFTMMVIFLSTRNKSTENKLLNLDITIYATM